MLLGEAQPASSLPPHVSLPDRTLLQYPIQIEDSPASTDYPQAVRPEGARSLPVPSSLSLLRAELRAPLDDLAMSGLGDDTHSCVVCGADATRRCSKCFNKGGKLELFFCGEECQAQVRPRL